MPSDFVLPDHHEIVSERKVVLKRLRVKEYPDQKDEMFKQTGKFGTPVNVCAVLEIFPDTGDTTESFMALWPVNMQQKTTGLWYQDMEHWEMDEDEFMSRLSQEMENLRFETRDTTQISHHIK